MNEKHEIPTLRSHRLKLEDKGLVLKCYIGKFPIPQRRKAPPRHLTEELKKIAQKTKLTEEEETRLNLFAPEIVK